MEKDKAYRRADMRPQLPLRQRLHVSKVRLFRLKHGCWCCQAAEAALEALQADDTPNQGSPPIRTVSEAIKVRMPSHLPLIDSVAISGSPAMLRALYCVLLHVCTLMMLLLAGRHAGS